MEILQMEDAAVDSLISNIWAIFPPLFKLIRRRWRRDLNGKFSVYHYETLGILLIRNSMTMAEISRYMGVSKSNLTPIIDSLVEERLLHRNADKIDRRFIHVALTNKGKAFMLEGKKRTKEDMKELFGDFSSADLKSLIKAFEQINQLIARLEN